MAKIIKKSKELQQHLFYLQSVLLRQSLWGIILVVSLVLGSFGFSMGMDGIFGALMVAGTIGFVLSVVQIVGIGRRARKYSLDNFGTAQWGAQLGILKSGVEGEKTAAKALQRLPDDYVVFTDLHISFEGQRSEMDFVVVGPTGVFVIETKNHNGVIQGDVSDHDLTQLKVGRGGTPYSKTFYNPVKQVGTHVYRLAHLLRDNGFRTHVNSVVFFTQARLQLSDNAGKQRTAVFTGLGDGGSALRAHITTQYGTFLSAQECERIAAFLNGLSGYEI